MRLIDADELLKKERRYINQVGLRCYAVSPNDIRKAPTIEAEPIRHGHWINDLSADWKCSVCRFNESPSKYCYCPNCGAKMDEVK